MVRFSILSALAAAGATNAYWLMGMNNALTKERLDPIVNPGDISAHSHLIFGGSGFRADTNTEKMRASTCTSTPIVEDKSNYWVPLLYFQWANGSVSDVDGGSVIYYLFDANGKVKPFPDNLRMLSGDPALRTYDPNSKAQQAVTFLCLDFNGKTTKHNEIPKGRCPSGIRSQVNFPMCWDGKNSDSPDHQSHVAFPSGGADSGTCNDPNFPVTIPRIFIEIYWDTGRWYDIASQAMNPEQPFVFSNGDATGYGYHGDFMMGWERPALERAIAADGCTCDIYGGMDCCFAKGVFTKNKDECRITPTFEEQITGTLAKLPGNNPVTHGGNVIMPPVDTSPARYDAVYEYRGKVPPKTANVIPGSGGKAPETPSVPSVPAPSVPSASASNGAPAPSASAVDPVPSAPSASTPAGGDPAPSAYIPGYPEIPKPSDVPSPSSPSIPSAPGGSNPAPSVYVPENPGSPKPSDVPAVSSQILINYPASSGRASFQPMPTNPPYNSTPRPPVNHAPGGTCKHTGKKIHKTHYRRRLHNSY